MLDFIESVTQAETIEELWAIHCDAMATFGFPRLLYGLTQSRTRGNFGPRDDFLILTNLDESYTKPFVDEGLYLRAPMVRWAAENTGACSWSWIANNPDALTAEEQKIVGFNLEHGVKAGYTISFRDISARSIGAIALIAEPDNDQQAVDEVWDRTGREIIAMNNVVHLKIMNLPYAVARKTLTPRQREALEWVGDGKTTQDIATIMGLTPATVEKHLRLAREALDVETTAQAVLKAAFQNQIFLLRA